MQRKYQMTRIESGDYLLPSNDARALWRIVSYEEDGSAEWLDGRRLTGKFWNAWRFDGTIEQAQTLMQRDPDEFLSWDRWTLWEGTLPTRKEAIEAALRSEERMEAATGVER